MVRRLAGMAAAGPEGAAVQPPAVQPPVSSRSVKEAALAAMEARRAASRRRARLLAGRVAVISVTLGVLLMAVAPLVDASSGREDEAVTAKVQAKVQVEPTKSKFPSTTSELVTGKSTNLMDNLLFASGLSVALVGAISASILGTLNRVLEWIRGKFIAEVTIPSSEEAFTALLTWVHASGQQLSGDRIKVVGKAMAANWVESYLERKKIGQRPQVRVMAGPGLHVCWYKGHIVWFQRTPIETLTVGHEHKPSEFEMLTMTCFTRGGAILLDLVDAALQMTQDKNNTDVQVYELHSWGFWYKALSKRPRPLESVVLDEGLANRLLQDAQSFLESQDWYAERGIPYRRGYLLYGPPGCGKTTFVSALAGALKRCICVVTLASSNLDDEDLRSRLQDTPLNSVILLEDVDAVFTGRESKQDSWRRRQVTFSGLLNALDGVASQEGRLLFMTTNHIERLDPALIRPGRCDVHVKFDYANHNQIQAMFRRFFPSEVRENRPQSPPSLRRQMSQDFRSGLPEGKLAMAALQGHFLRYKESPQQALDNIDQLVAQQSSVRGVSTGVPLVGWLNRLGLEQYVPHFARVRMFQVADIARMGDSGLERIGITHSGHRARIQAMLQGAQHVKEQFELAARRDAEAVFLQLFSGFESASNLPASELGELAHEFASKLQPYSVSIAQIMKHCATFKDDPRGAVDAAGLLTDATEGAGVDAGSLLALHGQSADEIALDAMDIETLLVRLGCSHQVAAVMATPGVCTVHDLRQMGSKRSKAISDAATAKLVTDLLEGKERARARFMLIESSSQAEAVFKSVYPAATMDTVRRFVDGLPTSHVSVGMVIEHCEYFCLQDALGAHVSDTTGERAAAAVSWIGQPRDVSPPHLTLFNWLAQFGVHEAEPKFRKANVHTLAHALQYRGCLASFQLSSYDLKVVQDACANGRWAFQLAQLVKSPSDALNVFMHVFPGCTDAARLFSQRLALGQVTHGAAIYWLTKQGSPSKSIRNAAGCSMPVAKPRLTSPVAVLQHAGLATEYVSVISNAGVTDVASFKKLSDDKLKELGITKRGHLHRIRAALDEAVTE